MRRPYRSALGLLLAITTHAETLQFPASPDSTQKFTIELSGVWRDTCFPKEPRVTIDGQTIRIGVRIVDNICSNDDTPYSHQVTVGPFEPGTYVIVAALDSNLGPTTLASAPITVRDAGAPFDLFPHAVSKTTGGLVLIDRVRGAFCEGSTPNCDSREVLFGDKPAQVERVNDFSFMLTVVAPPQDAEVVDVTVKYPDGTSSTARNAFRYYDPAAPPDPSLFTRILLPITRDARGALGSDFRVALSVYNGNRFTVPTWRPIGQEISLSPSITTPLKPEEPNGTIVFPLRTAAGALHFGSNVRDVSRVQNTFGTEIRVVREEDARVGASELLDIPTDPNFRLNLRLYGIDSIDETIQVSLHSPDNRVFLGDTTVAVQTSLHCTQAPCATEEPAFGSIPDLRAAFPGLQVTTTGVFRIHVEGRAGYRYWALLSVTNNTTQQITTVTPQ